MLTFVVAVLLVMGVLDRWRDLPAVRSLRRMLVDKPAAWINSLTRTHLIFAILMLTVVLTCGQMLAAMGPADMALVLLWDVSALIDTALVTATLAASARINGGWRLLVRALSLRRAPRRSPRARRRPTARKPSNDDEGHVDWRRAA